MELWILIADRTQEETLPTSVPAEDQVERVQASHGPRSSTEELWPLSAYATQVNRHAFPRIQEWCIIANDVKQGTVVVLSSNLQHAVSP